MRATSRLYSRGFTLLEVTLSLVVLLSAAILLTQFLVASSQQRKLGDQRRLALEEISNQMERVMAEKYEDLNAAAIEKEEFAPLVLEKLPAARLTASFTDEPGPPAGKRVRLEISWAHGGERVTPLGLTAWRYGPREVEP